MEGLKIPLSQIPVGVVSVEGFSEKIPRGTPSNALCIGFSLESETENHKILRERCIV